MARPRHLWQLPTFAAGLAAAVAAVAAFPPPPPDPSRAFTAAVAGLQAAVERRPVGPAEVEKLRPPVAAGADRYPELASKVRLLLGTADLLLAEGSPADPARWQAAADQFAQADAGKLDDEDARRLAYRRAMCDAALGRGDAKALAHLLAAPPTGEEQAGERLRLYADCLLRQTPPDPKKAAPVLKEYLSGPVRLPAADAARYKLTLSDALLTAGEPDKARPWLTELARAAPAEVQTRARLRLAGLAAADADWTEAVSKYEEALTDRTLPADQAAAARYKLGVGLTKTGRPTLAVPAFEAAADAAGPLVLAARLRLAELAVADPTGRGNRTPTVDRLEALARAAAGADELPADVTRPQLQAVFEQTASVCLNEGDFAAAVRACTLAAGVLPAGRDKVRRAEVLAAWAVSLGTSPDARAKLKEAAADYAALAADPGRADRGKLLRQAAELYRKAGDAAAADALTDQLTAAPGVPADVVAAAWLTKGEDLLGKGRFADAADALQKAAASSGPSAAVARVKLGMAHIQHARSAARSSPAGGPAASDAAAEIELGQQLLAQAAGSPADTPAGREAQQQALFELGKLLLSRGNLAEAEARFRQLVQAYPGGPQTGHGQLYLGSCLLLLARGDGAGGRPPADADARLAEAVRLFDTLSNGANEFLRREGGIRLVNAVLLQGKYDEVPGLCDRLAQPYRGTVQELILLSMAYKAHESARRPEKMAAARVQMEDLYARLADADFPGGTAEYTRQYWLSQWFEPLRKAAGAR